MRAGRFGRAGGVVPRMTQFVRCRGRRRFVRAPGHGLVGRRSALLGEVAFLLREGPGSCRRRSCGYYGFVHGECPLAFVARISLERIGNRHDSAMSHTAVPEFGAPRAGTFGLRGDGITDGR